MTDTPSASDRSADSTITAEAIMGFQDEMRDVLMDFLAEHKIPGNIDGGGCDSGDWRDFSIAELNCALVAIADWLYDQKAALKGKSP